MDDDALQLVYRSAVVDKLQHASDQQRLEALFICRSARCNLAAVDLGLFEQLYTTADKRLIDGIVGNTYSVLYHLLPPHQ